MSLPIHLQNIKSSGIYRFTFDKSEIANVDTSILRLVVGYSPKGVFNTVVYVKTISQFKEIFGDVSKKLEKRGIFFHRLALQSLERGPILCLNLKKFNNETTEAIAFDVNTLSTATPFDVKVEDIFDTTRLWKLSPDYLKQAAIGHTPSKTGYLTLSSIDESKSSCTVFMRKTTSTGYDLSIRDWYTNYSDDKQVPDWATGFEDSLVSDFMVDSYIFRGEFNADLAKTDTFKSFFDVDVDGKVTLKPYITNTFGEKQDTLEVLANTEGSGFVASYVGSLLPNFRNTNGAMATLDVVLNNESEKHNLMLHLDVDALDEGTIDLSDISLNSVVSVDSHIADILAGTLATPVTMLSVSEIKPEVVTMTYAATGYTAEDVSLLHGPDVVVFGLPTVPDATIAGTTLTTEDSAIASAFEVGALYHGATTPVKCLSVVKSDSDVYTITFSGTVALLDNTIVKYETSCATHGVVVPTFLEGYTFTNALPTSLKDVDKLAWQKTILSALTEYRGLRDALTNRKDVDYRYIIDTFESFVDSGIKSELTNICKTKDNAVAICNIPFMDTFKNCTYTSFTDSKGRFDVSYIGTGGNKLKSYTKLFSLPTVNNGASWGLYYSGIKLSDGSGKYNIPSAAVVGNNFIDKYISRQPYYIVAGPTFGRIVADGLIGPDFNFSQADLDVLEPMGINALVYNPRKGTYINSNQTAQQSPLTSLSKANVRELVIYLQDEIDAMLSNYHWQMNTQVLRDIVKGQADAICERVKANDGLYVYKNVCDETNNTDEIISNEMIVLDTEIEAALGAGKMVQRLTIHKKGGMTASIL